MPRQVRVQFEGEQIELEFDGDKPIRHLKEMLHEETGLPIPEIKIYYQGPNLEFDDEKTLRYYGLHFGAFFYMSDRRKDPTPPPKLKAKPKPQTLNLDYQAQHQQRVQQRAKEQQIQQRRIVDAMKSAREDLLEDDTAEEAKHDEDLARQQIAAKKAAKKRHKNARSKSPSRIPIKPENSHRRAHPSKKPQNPPKPIHISAKTPSGEIHQIQVEPSDTTTTIQQKIAAKTGIPIPHQQVSHNGITLPDGKTAKDLGLQDGSEVQVDIRKMPVTVRTSSGKRISLMVDPTTDSIADLKRQLETRSGVPAVDQNLSFDGSQLADGSKLAQDCGIAAGSVLDLKPKTIHITVRTAAGKTVKIKVDPNEDTTEAIQERIAKDTGIPVTQQNLTFNGKPVQRGKTLQQMGLQDGSEVKIDVPKLPVTVRTSIGKEIELMVDPSTDSIADIKKQLESKSGISVSDQNLSFKGNELTDARKLAKDCRIEAGSVLDLYPKTIHISAKTSTGRTVRIKVDPAKDTTDSIQERIAKDTGIPISQQDVSFNRIRMQKGKTLKESGLQDGSEVKVEVLKMPVTVRTSNGKEVELMVDPATDSIADMKMQLESKSGIPSGNQNLSFNGKELVDARKLAKDCGIAAGSVLDLAPKTIHITARTPTGKTAIITVDPAKDTKEAIEERVAKDTGIPAAQQNLTFNGKPMPKGKTLKDLGLQDGSEVKVEVLKMPVTVRTSNGKKIKLMVDPTADRVTDLKRQLESKSGIPVGDQNLLMQGHELIDATRLAKDCGIKGGSVLDLTPKTIHISAKTSTGKTVKVQVDPTKETTEAIQKRIANETGIPVTQQDLSFDGKGMQRGKTLKELGLHDGSEIKVDVLKMPVIVRTNTGKEIKLMVDPSSDTVADINKRLEREAGIQTNNQKLSMNGREISAANKLARDCGIEAGSVLDLESKAMTIHVITPTGEKIPIQVEPTFTSRSIKERLVREAGIPITQQVLEFNGKKFPNFKTVRDMGLKDGSELSVDVLRVPVTVRAHTGKKIKLMVNPVDDSIADLKKQLEAESGIPADHQKLSMLGSELAEMNKTAGDCGILSGSVLDLEPHKAKEITKKESISLPPKAPEQKDPPKAEPTKAPEPEPEPEPTIKVGTSDIYMAFTVPDCKVEPKKAEYEALAGATGNYYASQLQKKYGSCFKRVEVSPKQTCFGQDKPNDRYNVYVEWEIEATFHDGPGFDKDDIPNQNQLCGTLVKTDLMVYLTKHVLPLKGTSFAGARGMFTQQVNS